MNWPVSICKTGVIGALLLSLSYCHKQPVDLPRACLSVYPLIGDTLTTFHFDATCSTDGISDYATLIKYLDLDQDGIWEIGPVSSFHFAYRFNNCGEYTVSLLVENRAGQKDSCRVSFEVRQLIKDSIFRDTRNGKSFQAVLLDSQWLMSDNFRFGSRIEPDEVPADNQVVEYYVNDGLLKEDGAQTAYYTWNEITDYGRDTIQGICPDGWRVPNINDLSFLTTHYWADGNPGKAIGIGGTWGVDLAMNGVYVSTVRKWAGEGTWSEWWVNPAYVDQVTHEFYTLKTDLSYRLRYIYTGNRDDPSEFSWWEKTWGRLLYDKVALPLRCIRDEN